MKDQAKRDEAWDGTGRHTQKQCVCSWVSDVSGGGGLVSARVGA